MSFTMTAATVTYTIVLNGDGTAVGPAATPAAPDAPNCGRPATWNGFDDDFRFIHEVERVLREVYVDRTEIVASEIVLRATKHKVARGTTGFAHLMSQLPTVVRRVRAKLAKEERLFEPGWANNAHVKAGASPQERTYRRKGIGRMTA